jgi:hypothetical protein
VVAMDKTKNELSTSFPKPLSTIQQNEQMNDLRFSASSLA